MKTVYILKIAYEDTYKVGFSRNAKRRRREIAHYSGLPENHIELIFEKTTNKACKIESIAHTFLKGKEYSGPRQLSKPTEWYTLSICELYDVIALISQKAELVARP